MTDPRRGAVGPELQAQPGRRRAAGLIQKICHRFPPARCRGPWGGILGGRPVFFPHVFIIVYLITGSQEVNLEAFGICKWKHPFPGGLEFHKNRAQAGAGVMWAREGAPQTHALRGLVSPRIVPTKASAAPAQSRHRVGGFFKDSCGHHRGQRPPVLRPHPHPASPALPAAGTPREPVYTIRPYKRSGTGTQFCFVS